jgi:hypothetical protein
MVEPRTLGYALIGLTSIHGSLVSNWLSEVKNSEPRLLYVLLCIIIRYYVYLVIYVLSSEILHILIHTQREWCV